MTAEHKVKGQDQGEGEVGSPGHAATSMHGYSRGMQQKSKAL